jgi:hypothetical protein
MSAPRTVRVPELLVFAVLASACGCGPEPEPTPAPCTTRTLADGAVEQTGSCDAGADAEDLDGIV